MAIDIIARGMAAGKADLVNGKVPSEELPSYVDDVLEYANLAAFPATGETGKIYVALDTNKTYRWSGSTYIEVGGGSGSGAVTSVNSKTGAVVLTGEDIAYDSSATSHTSGSVSAAIASAETFYVDYTPNGSDNTDYDDIYAAYTAGKNLVFRYHHGSYGLIYGNLLNYNAEAHYGSDYGVLVFSMANAMVAESNSNPLVTSAYIYKSNGSTVYVISEKNFIEMVTTMPSLSSTYYGNYVLYVGATTSEYESGKIYRRDSTSWSLVGDDLVTSWSATTSDSNYPSEKLVKDSLDAKANIGFRYNAILGTSWSGSDPYSQAVTVSGYTVTQNTKVDVYSSISESNSLASDGVTELRVDNEGGSLKAYAVGGMPSYEILVQLVLTEVNE